MSIFWEMRQRHFHLTKTITYSTCPLPNWFNWSPNSFNALCDDKITNEAISGNSLLGPNFFYPKLTRSSKLCEFIGVSFLSVWKHIVRSQVQLRQHLLLDNDNFLFCCNMHPCVKLLDHPVGGNGQCKTEHKLRHKTENSKHQHLLDHPPNQTNNV